MDGIENNNNSARDVLVAAKQAAMATGGGNGNIARRKLPPLRKISNIDLPKTKIGTVGSASNLVNSILGAGIIGIPFAIQQSGFVVGLALLVLVGFFTDKSLRMIVDLAAYHPKLKHRHVLTFEDLMTIPYGQFGRVFVLVSMFTLAYGAMVAYLLVIKDNVPDLLGLGESFLEREGVMFATSLVVMLPLSFCRDISELACTSLVSVMADVVLVAIVCYFAPVRETVGDAGGIGQVVRDNWINSGLFIGLGVLSTALACQQSSFLISGTLRDHSSTNWARVTGSSLLVATALSLLFGVVGYLGFLDETEGDVLRNFGQDGMMVNVARALMSVAMVLTYPMESFVARHVLSQLFYGGKLDDEDQPVDDRFANKSDGVMVVDDKENRCSFGMLRVGRREHVTIGLYAVSLLPALIIDDLGPVLSLTGSLGASSIAYIAPGLVYLGLNGDYFLSLVMPSDDSTNESAKLNGDPDVELPVAGDVSAKMEQDTETTSRYLLLDGNTRTWKPWWWYPMLMPIWVAIARRGASGTERFLSDFDDDKDSVFAANNDEDHVDEEETIGPTRYDLVYSIVFIAFGVVAAVAGVASNVYVEVNDMFFAP